MLSRFNLYVTDYPDAGSTLVHNTFSGAFAVLGHDVLAELRRGEQVAETPDLADPDVGIVVANHAAEEAEYRSWFERRRARKTMDVLVSVNLACNFACTYCCQDSVLDGTTMSPEVADQTARFLAEHALAARVPALKLHFIGGEPLLHPHLIARIARGCRALLDGKIELSFNLITNGYFLSDEILDELCPLGLASAQITIDGDAGTHSKTRVSKKGEDTFRRIFANAMAASRRIEIKIKGNYTSDTVYGFAPLVDQLAAAGLPAGSEVSFQPALAGLGAPADTGNGACTCAGAEMKYHVALHDHVAGAGFQPSSLHVLGPCAFHDHHHFALDPEGRVYKCPGFLGHPEWSIGHVATGLTPRYQQMLRVNPQRECGGCAHRPNCAGGCIAVEWTRTGRMEGIGCERPYLDQVTAEALPRAYITALHDNLRSAAAEFPAPNIGLPAARPTPAPSQLPEPRGRRAVALRVLTA